MGEVMRKEEQEISNVQSPAGAMMALIERAATSSDVDVEKLEKLLDMKERWEKGEAEKAFNRDFIALQDELPDIGEGGQIVHKGQLISKYARWDEDINPVIKPILARHGFTLSFETDTADRIKVTAHLIHKDGHSRSSSFSAPIDKSGAKNEVQGMGSSVSYAKRYAAGPLLNLTMRGLDDDGASFGKNLITDHQLADLIALMDELGDKLDRPKFHKWLESKGVTEIKNMPASMYGEAIRLLEAKRKS